MPSLPLERPSPGAILGHRRCHEHAGPQPLCAAYRTRFRPWCGRQMDRCRDRRAWRSARSDPSQPQSERPWRSDGRSARLSRPAASLDHIADEFSAMCHQQRAALPERRNACFMQDAPFPAHRPRPICAPVASPVGSTGPPCAITRRSTIAHRGLPQRKPAMLRWKPGRRCLLPSPISTAMSPAFSAPGLIHGGRPRRRSPIRAAPLVISSAMVSASAERPTFSPSAKVLRPCWRSNRCCPHCLSLPGSRPTISPPSTCPLPPDRVRGRLVWGVGCQA